MLRESMNEQREALAQLPIVAPIPTATGFSDAVRIADGVLQRMELTVHDVKKYLKTHGFELPEADTRSCIATALQSMREKNLIIRTYEGKGRIPSKYILKT